MCIKHHKLLQVARFNYFLVYNFNSLWQLSLNSAMCGKQVILNICGIDSQDVIPIICAKLNILINSTSMITYKVVSSVLIFFAHKGFAICFTILDEWLTSVLLSPSFICKQSQQTRPKFWDLLIAFVLMFQQVYKELKQKMM